MDGWGNDMTLDIRENCIAGKREGWEGGSQAEAEGGGLEEAEEDEGREGEDVLMPICGALCIVLAVSCSALVREEAGMFAICLPPGRNKGREGEGKGKVRRESAE